MKLVSYEKSGKDYIITVECNKRRSFLSFLFNKKGEPYLAQFIGNCTVWYYYPQFRRADTSTESKLCDIWTKIRFEEKGR